MQLFNNNIAVGLFDSDQDVEKAVSQLQERGFGAENDETIQIIDEHRLTTETPIDVPSQNILAQTNPGMGGVAPAVEFNPVSAAGAEAGAGAIERSTLEFLQDKGLGEEESSYYARQVARGNSLVVVETTEERAAKAADLMNETGARAMKE